VPDRPRILMFIEHGGYPLPLDALRAAGYRIDLATTVRAALGSLRRETPDAIVAEFNFKPRYGDRVSDLDSLLAGVDRISPPPPVIVINQPEDAHRVADLSRRHALAATLPLPPATDALRDALARVCPRAGST